MKKLIKYQRLQDEKGNGVSGSTIVAYPAGTATHGTTASDLGYGNYKFTIDPTDDNLVLSKLYDIYIDGILNDEDVDLGVWEWFIADKEVDASQTFNFADLIDENGEGLPITITNPQIVLVAKNNRQAKVSFNTTSLTITLDSGGNDINGIFDIIIKVIK